jgi:16S rRNA (cytidine1402-2'-O)-methyltransferase
VIFFEAPHRISKTLVAMSTILGDRPITVARELTKLHEEILHTTARGASELKINERGEFTIVLAPYIEPAVVSEPIDDARLSSYFYQLTNSSGFSRRQAVTATAREFGLSPNDVYGRLERLKA